MNAVLQWLFVSCLTYHWYIMFRKPQKGTPIEAPTIGVYRFSCITAFESKRLQTTKVVMF